MNIKKDHIDYKQDLYGDELPIAVFVHREAFVSDDFYQDVIDKFYEFSKLKEYKELFKRYPFDVDGIEAQSSILTDALRQMFMMKMIEQCHGHYITTQALRYRYNVFIKSKLTPEQIELLKIIAQSFD